MSEPEPEKSDMTRTFRFEDLIGVIHLASCADKDRVADLLSYMTGERLTSRQLMGMRIYAQLNECRAELLRQHPDLDVVGEPENLNTSEDVQQWLAQQYAIYGETREVAPLARAADAEPPLPRQRVAVTVFAEVEAVDAYDGAAILRQTLSQRGIYQTAKLDTELRGDLGSREVTVVHVMEATSAYRNGYLTTGISTRAWRDYGLEAPPVEQQ